MKAIAKRVPSIVVGIALVLGSAVAAQEPRPDQAASVRVVRDVETGDYRVTFNEGAREREFLLVLPTGVEPEIRVSLSEAPGGRGFRYSYAVNNGATARQELHSVSVEAVQPTRLVGSPPGWRSIATGSSSRLSWFEVPLPSGPLGGIDPGASVAGFVIESQNLPGPSQARFMGSSGPIRLPDGLPSVVRYRLIELLDVVPGYVVVETITPSIPYGINEPERTMALGVARVFAAYGPPLERSAHPSGNAIVEMLPEVIAGFAHDEETGRTLVAELIALAGYSGGDAWTRELATGLRLALGAVTTGRIR